ncbi:GAF domain-containing sensor histidine kinase [Crocosphaera sp. Alani8]|uniref:GAF domain-containing sensor histidine kinase n=1 Tax=Crocosphaera sp. Alani8 TaxID=3038952 RepID=UPI00313EC02A
MSNFSTDYTIEQYLINEIVTTSDYDGTLENITRIITDKFLVDFCIIVVGFSNSKHFYTWNDSGTYRLIDSQNQLSNLIQIPWIQEFKGESKIKYISDLDNKKYQNKLPFFENLGIKSLLGISTKFKEKTNGVIILGKSNPYPWNNQDKTKLKKIMNIVSIACYISEVSTMIDERHLKRDSSFSLSNIPELLEENPILRLWWEGTRNRLDKEIEWNKKVIYNMITIMSDQTRNPLTNIKMGITDLRNRELSPEQFKHRVTMLEQEWNKLNNINDKILQLKYLKPHYLNYNLVSTNLVELLKNITNSVQDKWQENSKNNLKLNTNFNIEPQQLVETDIQHLSKIVEELLTNANKFSLSNSLITLEVNRNNEDEDFPIVMTVSNLSEYDCTDNKDEFFKPFYREQSVIDSGVPGIGVGLYIVKDLVELLQGKISVQRLPTENPKHCKIVFRLVLPQSLSSS